MCDCKNNIDLSLIDPVLFEVSNDKTSLIYILQRAQEIYGYLPTELMYYIADKTGTSPAHVLGVATFYSQFRLKPIGKNLILLCKGTACYVNGAVKIEEAVFEELGIRDGETSEDGLFSLGIAACLGCCSLAPVMMINDKTYGSLTPDKAKEIIRSIRKENENEL